ncbi:MAG TPA: transcriptional regulator [Actinobacteria bacterium]|nr:transcriptional regulator [Actinomycetota bacterium]
MDLIRIGSKVISRKRLTELVADILKKRSNGATQAEVASNVGVERSFVSHLESLGEVRRGNHIALIGFPVKNKREVKKVAKECGVDYVYLLSEKERVFFADKGGVFVFNEVLDILAKLQKFDIVIFLASDKRVKSLGEILNGEVIGIPLGKSPIKIDKKVDVEELGDLLRNIIGVKEGVRVEKGRKRKSWIFKKKPSSKGKILRARV